MYSLFIHRFIGGTLLCSRWLRQWICLTFYGSGASKYTWHFVYMAEFSRKTGKYNCIFFLFNNKSIDDPPSLRLLVSLLNILYRSNEWESFQLSRIAHNHRLYCCHENLSLQYWNRTRHIHAPKNQPFVLFVQWFRPGNTVYIWFHMYVSTRWRQIF